MEAQTCAGSAPKPSETTTIPRQNRWRRKNKNVSGRYFALRQQFDSSSSHHRRQDGGDVDVRCHGTSSGSGALPVNCPAVVDVRLASGGVAIIGTFCLWQKPVGVPLETESVGVGDGDLSVDGVVFPTSRESEYKLAEDCDTPTWLSACIVFCGGFSLVPLSSLRQR